MGNRRRDPPPPHPPDDFFVGWTGPTGAIFSVPGGANTLEDPRSPPVTDPRMAFSHADMRGSQLRKPLRAVIPNPRHKLQPSASRNVRRPPEPCLSPSL